MPRRAATLSVRQIEQFRKPGFWAVGPSNLYLKIGTNGGRSWVFRYFHNDRRRDMGLGGVDLVTLAEARDRVIDLRRGLLAGVDPLTDRQAKRSASRLVEARSMTFRQCADAYIAAKRAGWRGRHAEREWRNSITQHAAPLLDLPVAGIDTPDVLKAIEPIWTRKLVTAQRVRGRIESVLDWAGSRGFRAAGDNPARWRKHLENLLAVPTRVHRVEHLAAMPFDEIPAFLDTLRQHDEVAAAALDFTILTACRTAEVRGARWSEIDLKARLWTIRAERMKGGAEHVVPLSAPALAILTHMQELRSGDFVFPGRFPGQTLAGDTMWKALHRITGRTDLTVHGFRSSFSTWAGERTNFARDVVERCLAHATGSKVEQSYRRGLEIEKRRQVMDAWARYCSAPEPIGATVSQIRAPR